MQIVIVPGPRDEEMVQEIKLNREMLSGEEWEAYVFDCADCEEWLDALYYACGENQEAVAEQAEYHLFGRDTKDLLTTSPQRFSTVYSECKENLWGLSALELIQIIPQHINA